MLHEGLFVVGNFCRSEAEQPDVKTSFFPPKYISSCRSQAEQPDVRPFWRGFPKSPANHLALLLAMPPKYAFGILTSGPCGKAKIHKAGHLKNSRVGLSWLPS